MPLVGSVYGAIQRTLVGPELQDTAAGGVGRLRVNSLSIHNILDVLVRDVHRIDGNIPGLHHAFLQLRPGH